MLDHVYEKLRSMLLSAKGCVYTRSMGVHHGKILYWTTRQGWIQELSTCVAYIKGANLGMLTKTFTQYRSNGFTRKSIKLWKQNSLSPLPLSGTNSSSLKIKCTYYFVYISIHHYWFFAQNFCAKLFEKIWSHRRRLWTLTSPSPLLCH